MSAAGRAVSGHSDLQSATEEEPIDALGVANQGTMVPRALTALAVIGFAIPVVAYFWFVHHYGVNAIWQDQWDDITVISHPTLGNLWALHNENRIFFPNLIVLVLAGTTHFNIHTEEYVSAVMLIAAVGLIILAHKQRSPSTPWLYYCPVGLVMLSFVQFNNSLWGFQIAWYLVLLALAGTLFLLDRATLTTPLLVGAIVVAIIGSFSSLQGLLIWPAGLVLIYHRSRRRAQTAVWIASALTAGAVYFYNASSIVQGSSRNYVDAHPVQALEFFFAAIGDVVREGLPADGHNQGIIALGVVIFAVGLWTAIAYGVRRSEGGSPLGVALICFGILFAAVTTAGRAASGLVAAGPSRYTTFDLLIPVGCYLALLDGRPARAGARAATWVARTTVAVAILLVLVLGTKNGLAGASSWHQTFAEAADVTLNIDHVPDSVVQDGLYPFGGRVAFIRRAAHITKSRHLGVFAPGAALRYPEVKPLVESAPVSAVLRPTNGATLRGDELLDATAGDSFGPFEIGVAKVDFQLTGGDFGPVIIGSARLTWYGWIDLWNTTTVANGSYVLQSLASASDGKTTDSVGVAVVVDNH